MTTLYLSGVPSISGTEICCSLKSSVVLFMVKYCQARIKLVFVHEEDGYDSSNVCSYSITNFGELDIEFSPWHNLPNVVKNVSLPSVYQPDQRLVRSGLCVVLRHTIKDAHQQNPLMNLTDLLGFKHGSMKMCAEVSSWTKLCEIDIPDMVSDLMEKLNHRNLHTEAEAETCWTLPSELTTLDNHFKQKCKVHNDNKGTRAEVSALKEFFTKFEDTNCDPQNATSSEELLKRLNENTKASDQSLHSSIDALSFDPTRIFIERTIHLSHGVRRFTVDKCFEKTRTSETKSKAVGENNAGKTNTSKDDSKEMFDFDDFKAVVMELEFTDIDYKHLYSEGIELTIADLILITYIYHLMDRLDHHRHNLFHHIPAVLKWTEHMLSLSRVEETFYNLGLSVKNCRKSCQRFIERNSESEVSQSLGGLHLDGRSIVFQAQVKKEEEEEVELSRNIKMKHRALKPEVIQTLQKFETAGIRPAVGVHPRGDDVEFDWDSLPPGVHPKEGSVPVKRTVRKCQQLENLASAVQAIAKPGDIIVDFCSGGGHLGILCAYLLPQCQVYLVENKEESLLKSSSRLCSLGLQNVTLYQCNLDYFVGSFSIGLCLHACGSATDMVLELCTKCQASFVICPCCYGGIHNTHLLSYPRSDLFLQAHISYTDFLTIGHAADQTEFDIKLEQQGRTCMRLVDTDRVEYAKQQNYNVSLCSLKPLTCSPKNNLLIGTLRKTV